MLLYIYSLSHLAPCLIGGAGTQERRLKGKIHGQAAPSGGRGRASALGGRASQEPQYLRQEAAGRCGSPCRATNPQRCLAPQSQAGRSVRQGASVSGMVSGGVCLGERGVEKVCPNHLRLTYTECRSRSSKNYRHASSDMGVDAVFAALGPFHSISSCTVSYLVLYLILDSIAISLLLSLYLSFRVNRSLCTDCTDLYPFRAVFENRYSGAHSEGNRFIADDQLWLENLGRCLPQSRLWGPPGSALMLGRNMSLLWYAGTDENSGSALERCSICSSFPR